MLRAHKIRLYPTNLQAVYFRKACGVRRKAYNWALATWNQLYESGEKTSALQLKKLFNSIKREEFPYVLEVTKCATENAILDLGKAYTNFFSKRAQRPKFKKKGRCVDSFKLNNDQFYVIGKHVSIPKLGRVKLAEELRFEGKIMSATVSTRADFWFISILVDTNEEPKAIKNHEAVGIDLGIKCFAQMSTDLLDASFAPKPLAKNLKKLKRLSRAHSRKQLGSSNRKKASKKLAKLHYKISSLRSNTLHQLTTGISKKFGIIGIEDLSVRWMLANRHLSRAVSDLGFYEFRRQLEYKQQLFGTRVHVVSRFYPSTKTCSNCGCINKNIQLKDRIYECPECGFVIDRDFNAAINLERAALVNFRSTEGSSGS